jgi:DNA repair exonuclease SbcCD ATPase subunit
MSNVQYPKVITSAQEGAAQRREQIQQEEAQLQISKVKLERELQEARLTRQIEFEKAQTEAAAFKTQAASITPEVLKKQELDNQAAWIQKWNGQLPDTVTADVFSGFNKK